MMATRVFIKGKRYVQAGPDERETFFFITVHRKGEFGAFYATSPKWRGGRGPWKIEARACED